MHLSDLNLQEDGYIVAIGNFDGVHQGHKKILSLLSKKAKALGGKSLVITFEPNPKLFFNKQENFLLTTLEEKIKIIQDLFLIDQILILPFDDELKNLSAKDFIAKFLIEKINIKFLIIGANFRFGKNQEGDIDLLRDYLNDNLYAIDLAKISEHICSSSAIKKFLKEGQIDLANNLLGYRYFIKDIIVEGNQLATKIGFPTINIKNSMKILPKFGVYYVSVIIDNKKLYGVANIGVRPTITQDNQPLLEVHILDFNANLYGQKVKVEFIKFIREEKKFESLDKLVYQIGRDVEFGKSLMQ
jgi:riboflavin kinase/FMN adenylyltransferase